MIFTWSYRLKEQSKLYIHFFLIRFHLFLAGQNSLFCRCVLPYYLMYYLKSEHTGLYCKQFYRLMHVVLLVISQEPNELEVLLIGLLPH